MKERNKRTYEQTQNKDTTELSLFPSASPSPSPSESAEDSYGLLDIMVGDLVRVRYPCRSACVGNFDEGDICVVFDWTGGNESDYEKLTHLIGIKKVGRGKRIWGFVELYKVEMWDPNEKMEI